MAMYSRAPHDLGDPRRSGGSLGARLGPPPPEALAPPGAPPAAAPGPAPAPPKPQEPEIDRTKVCPLLLRVFTKIGGHHRLEEFATRGQEPSEEAQMYTWPDATLRELTTLVKQVQPAARRPNARLGFAFIYPDRRGRNVMRQVGEVVSNRAGPDDKSTLRLLGFQTGDFLDVAIY